MAARSEMENLVGLGERVVEAARAAGADVAEAVVRAGSHLTTKVRMREPELVEEAGSRALGLRVMLGQQVAVTYTSDLEERGVKRLVEDALELARLSEPDPFAGPPDPSLLSRAEDHRDLNVYDPSVAELGADEALARALAGEEAAFATDARITNSEGSSFSRVEGSSVLVTSGGFLGTNRGSYASIVVSPVADDTDGKKRSGYHWAAKRHLAELEDARLVGEEAARRTLRKLGAGKIDSAELPVVFEP
ncbi:MAG: TldD/PmbA family protein, partial [Myxococcales bacterium]|nr:TldD/PmbA family protein [Myxococcales bacterium]